jgi:hypothetical protein
MQERSMELKAVAHDLGEAVDDGSIAKPENVSVLLKYLDRLIHSEYKQDLKVFDTFLPPPLVKAAKERHCVPFFGAGVSAEADLPSWWDLLDRLGFQADFAGDPELEHDPLTAAEVLASSIGMPMLDSALRASIKRATTPTLAHFLLAALNQDVYVTTNYDCLFEVAWKTLYNVEPRVVTTDADLRTFGVDRSFRKSRSRPLLFKLHGSLERDSEELILTRSQYRRHYRTNQEMFASVRNCLARSNTLFVGFGHRDPEITRLVEDVVHIFETRKKGRKGARTGPAFYSLQFNMGERTPEIFAARGMVALQPPLTLDPPEKIDARTVSLVRSQLDLLAAVDSSVHDQLDLDSLLSDSLDELGQALGSGLDELGGLARSLKTGQLKRVGEKRLRTLSETLGALAGQGVYLLDEDDSIVEVGLPAGLSLPERKTKGLHRRPYVRQAHMYREPFVSATVSSLFNGNATAFLCVPILDNRKQYRGLLFSAFQVGAWALPLELRDALRKRSTADELSFVLIDGDGVLLLPPNSEFAPRKVTIKKEGRAANIGFDFERLVRLSRRDKLVERVWNNIVPLARDDDVLGLGGVEMYSVVAEVPQTRWKLALSVPTPRSAVSPSP